MKKQTEFCLPTAGKAVSFGDDWIHEIKYDGYRMRVVRNGKAVRLFSRGGTDWTKRYPWIVETALKIKQSNFAIDGEAVILGSMGYRTSMPCSRGRKITRFNCTHSIASA